MGKSKKVASKQKTESPAATALQPDKRQPEPPKPAAASKAVQAAKTTAAPKAPREERNGVKRPKEGGVCAAVWTWLDENGDHKLSDMKEVIAAKGWNQNNVSAELAGWRKFNGIARVQPK